MEKGEHLKRQNRPTMLQLQYLQGLSRVEKKRGAQGSIAESYGVNRSTVNRYFKNCIERGILTESLEFTAAGEEWLERYTKLYENLEKYLEEIGAKPEEIEESLDVMVENIDIHMLELMINAYTEKKSVYKKKENELDQEIQHNLQKCERHVQDGSVSVDGTDVRKIPTKHLRDMESYVTQETHLFHDSIANNIAIAKPGASREEIMEAAKKASIHDFIMTLPKGYDTEVGELGDTLSGGEKQRIGIARAFLHECPLILLDEPTSNLDSLNEGIILKSLKESAEKKTVVLVSHRVSTMNVADVVYEMENGRIS